MCKSIGYNYGMKHRLKCEICKKGFESGWANKKTCSDSCKTKRIAKITGRIVNEKISSGSVGAMSELFVCGELLRKGYSVFRSLSPSCFCDLIAIKGKETLTIEVRTGYIHPETKRLNFPKNTHGEITTYAVYERNTGQIFFFNSKLKRQIL